MDAMKESVDLNHLEIGVGIVLRSATELHTQLKLKEDSFLRAAPFSFHDGRAVYLYFCVEEVLKGATGTLRWIEFIRENNIEELESPNSEMTKLMKRAVEGSVYDEQRMWARKLKELLTELLLFQTTNTKNHFRLYLACRHLESQLGFQTDLREFFSCENENVSETIRDAIETVTLLQGGSHPEELWFLRKGFRAEKARAGRVFSSIRERLRHVLKIASPVQRLLLGFTYDRGYSLASRSIHASIGHQSEGAPYEEMETEINRVICLSAQVVEQGFKVLGQNPPGELVRLNSAGSAEEVTKDINAKMAIPFAKGDLVFACGSYLGVVTDVAESPYGYTSCKVHFLDGRLLADQAEEWFASPHIKMICPKAEMIAVIDELLSRQGLSRRADPISDAEYIKLIIEKTNEMKQSGDLARLLSRRSH